MRRLWASLLASVLACTETAATAPDATVDVAVDRAVSDVALDVAPDVTPDVARDVSPPPAPLRAEAPLRRYVDPLVGTGGEGFGTGSAFPGPQRPFGLARPGADTTDAQGAAVGYAHCAGYAHFDTHIAGFSQLHLHGTGIVDEGPLSLMPVIGMTPDKTRKLGRLQPFRHARETAAAGYYRVTFDGSEVTTEVTATDRVALYRVTFPTGSDGVLTFDAGYTLTDVRVTAASLDVGADELSGRVHFEGSYSDRFGGVDIYWVARLSRPLAAAGTWQGRTLDTAVRHRDGTDIGAYVPVDTTRDGSVTVAIGLSYTDVAHARANLMMEAADLDFDRVRRESEAQWESLLSRVQVTARGDAALRQMYTAVYHTLLMPTLMSDVDGSYRGVDRMVRHAEGWRAYSDLSLWDTYRTEHPWLSMVYPEYERDFVRSLVAMADAVGFYPRWPLATGETGGMLGDCGAFMVADSWLRGVRDFDVERAWMYARRSAFTAPPMSRREDLGEYMSLGYVPVETGGGSASVTMEYAYADAALANWARGLGHTDDAARLDVRAHAYRNLWDASQEFLVGRHRDGSFEPLRSLTAWQPVYAEGTAWQYLWFAPHDLDGLATTLGGRERFLTRLRDFFDMTMASPRTPLPDRYYWQGNEPDIHAPWIPSAFGDASLASRYVDQVRRSRYGGGPDGLPGNDDAGTMSAWYVFAALGMYPVAGTDTWLVAAPSVTEARVTLAGGATLEVRAPDADTGALQVQRLQWNGTALVRPVLDQAAVARGGALTVTLAQ